jgi:DNA-binding response OmpR family regulator
MTEKILIVDDEPTTRKLLSMVASSNGFAPQAAASGEEALRMLHGARYQAILLDINMAEGGMDGFEVIKRVRQAGCDTPIMVVSGRVEDADALYGLALGADDYVTKPFNPVVLGAKVKAMVRRSHKAKAAAKEVSQVGPFRFHADSMKLFKNGEEICLSSKELRMMRLFLSRPGQVFTKEQLYEHVWGDAVVDGNAVMVYVSHLRAKIEDDPKKPKYIKTVWGIGYRFSAG